jgi:hypothetical protein
MALSLLASSSCLVEQAGLKLKGKQQKERRKKRQKQQEGGRGGAQGVHTCQGEERTSNGQPQPCREGTVHHRMRIFTAIFADLFSVVVVRLGLVLLLICSSVLFPSGEEGENQ